MKKVYDSNEAAEYLGVTRAQINNLVRKNKIKIYYKEKYKSGYKAYFLKEYLDEYKNKRDSQFPRDKGKFVKGYHYSPKTEFKPGKVYYKHPKGTRTSPETEFKKNRPLIPSKGETPEFTPKPRERKRGNRIERYVYTRTDVKVPIVIRGKETVRSKVTGYARYVYGLDNIPKGYVIYHKDGNPFNNDIGNLECISRAELLRRNREGKHKLFNTTNTL